MSLSEYQRKRDFHKTSEPPGSRSSPEKGPLRFVVQKHQASRLHYDFRLELDGVLKSWALPKGPSLNPDEKKLAVQVEDHPWEYRNFEGLIAPGNYGAGTVMIWDEGTYHVPESAERDKIEAHMRRGLAKGHLVIFLEGHKLKGGFHLVRLKNEEGGENWLLMKKEDQYASRSQDVLAEELSARSGLDLDGIRAAGNLYQPPEIPATGSPAVETAAAPEQAQEADPDDSILTGLDLSGAQRAPFPEGLEPMLATLTDEPFDREGWFYEVKWDGFRALAEVRAGQAELCSRHNKSYEEEFRPVVADLKKLGFEAVLDGEVVVVDEQGRAEFKLLQNYRKTGQGLLVYYVFDLLYLEGYDLRALPLARRKALLRSLLPPLPRIKFSDHVEDQGVALFRAARENDLEGIIAKDKNSPYRSGVRSQDWLKFKVHQRQEAVIGGWTEPRGTRSELGALLLGVYEGRDLIYVGHTGGGFTDELLAEIKQKLKPLITPRSPFKKKPKTNAPPTWVEPKLICEVKFSDWTEEGMMRQPIFLGLREDKSPQQVRREKAIPSTQALNRIKLISRETKKETVNIGGHEVTLSNPRKVFWPEEAITKGDLVQYYRVMAPYLLPHLRDRPLSLNRFPNGIQGKSFFQKDVDDAPDWVRRVPVPSDSASEGSIDYVIADSEAALAWLANLGTVELNPWNARIDTPEQPDYLVLDLDPLERPFDDVITVANTIHAVLEEIEIPHAVKTSGATGLHIFTPLGAKYNYEQTRQFAWLVAQLVNKVLPEMTSLERSPAKRPGKIYLDTLQNRAGQTMVAPYSLRPRPGAPVSTPLAWDEVRPGLTPRSFTMHTILPRLEKTGDLWAAVLGPGIDMQAGLERLQAAWGGLVERLGKS